VNTSIATRAYKRRVQPVHRSEDWRAKKGPKALAINVLFEFFHIFLGVCSTIFSLFSKIIM